MEKKAKIVAGILAGSSFIFPVELSNANLGREIMPPVKREIKPLVNPRLIDAIIEQESNGKANAYNKGAVGLMQLRPIIYNKYCGLSKAEAFNPELNVKCGTKFMAYLIEKYKGDTKRALLHYNNGYKIKNKQYADNVMKRMKG